MKTNSDLLQQLLNPSMEYRPVSLWFIIHYLREDLLRRQIREMAETGCGGIMFHGRDGLRSGYLEKEANGRHGEFWTTIRYLFGDYVSA